MSGKSLGDRIRELREEKGYTIDQLHTRTRIMVKYLEALEEGRWDLLPGQVYLKPFIKNIAEALDVSYKELYALVEHTDIREEKPPIKQVNKRFDYRWLAVFLMLVLVILIILLLKPTESSKEAGEETPSAVTIINDGRIKQERHYSTSVDLARDFVDPEAYHTLELTALDSVWVLIAAGSDTLYNGILRAGRKISRGSAKPLKLVMGRRNCLDVAYDGVLIDRQKYLSDRRSLDSEQLKAMTVSGSGGRLESQ